MTQETMTVESERVAALEAKIDRLQDQLALLLERQHRQQELVEELGPISREMMGVMTQRLADLEQRGYFEFGSGVLGVLDKVVTSYNGEELEELGESVVGILDTVKSLTQPEILRMAHEASAALREADDEAPMGPYGVFKAASNDKDVRRGMAVMVSLLRHLGKGAKTMSNKDRLKAVGPKRPPRGPRISSGAPAATSRPSAPVAAPAPAAPAAAGFEVDGVAFTGDGFLADPDAWTPEIAQSIATRLGVGQLGDEHWKVIEFSRGVFKESGASPNVRKISRGSGVGVRDLYALFPEKPGVMSAQVAGIPKPKGCI